MIAGVARRSILTSMVGVLVLFPLMGAQAARAAGPDEVRISGANLTAPISVTAASDAEIFRSVLGLVDYVASRTPEAKAPAASKLGPKYTAVVLVKGVPKQTYDLYPLATGGPKVFRPAKQPDKRKVAAGWFYGRVTMPDVLRDAGAPIPNTGLRSGAGGGGPVGGEFEPLDDFDSVLGEWQRVLLLNTGVLVVIAIGLAGIAYVIRRKV